METIYTYTIYPFNSDQFTTLINQRSIMTPFYIETGGTNVSIVFSSALSAPDKVTLDDIVDNYVYAPNVEAVSVTYAPVIPQTVLAGTTFTVSANSQISLSSDILIEESGSILIEENSSLIWVD